MPLNALLVHITTITDTTTPATMRKAMRKLITAFLIVGSLVSPCIAQTESLLIGPGDSVVVEVFDTPEMTQRVRVNDAGTVRLQLIGDVKLAGETPSTAAKIVERALVDKQIMRTP